jgi:hypothetical protein
MTAHFYYGTGRQGPGFVLKHLLGEYSLARSYWLHTVLLGWGFAALGGWLLRELAERAPMRQVAIAALAFEAFALLVWSWSAAGTWMAAMRRLVMGGGRFWAVAAMLTIGLAMFATVREAWEWRPGVEDLWAVAQGRQPTPSFELILQPGGRALLYRGGINEGAAEALERRLATAPPQLTTLLLDSPGGWLREGERLADTVRRHRLDTRAARECYSSCTLVLLAGRERSAAPGAVVGFHRGRPMGQTRRPRTPAKAEEAKLYLDAGLAQAFVDQILATPNDSIWIPSRQALLEAQVLTR